MSKNNHLNPSFLLPLNINITLHFVFGLLLSLVLFVERFFFASLFHLFFIVTFCCCIQYWRWYGFERWTYMQNSIHDIKKYIKIICVVIVNGKRTINYCFELPMVKTVAWLLMNWFGSSGTKYWENIARTRMEWATCFW